jgi:hypothetical protein
MKHISELKKEIKLEALEIRKLRFSIKENQRAHKYAGDSQCRLVFKSRNFRIKHIAYSEFLGRTREEIENPKDINKLNLNEEEKILQIKSQYTFEREVACEQ